MNSSIPSKSPLQGLWLFVIMLACAGSALAAGTVTVTNATGGSVISADTTGIAWTSLSGPTVVESAAGTIGTGTIILNVPAGFIFNTASTVTATVSKNAGPNGTRLALASSTATVTTTTITIQVTGKSTEMDKIVWSGIQVQPTSATPLASGNLTDTGTSAFTYASGSSASNYGTLTETASAVAQLTITQQPSDTATAGAAFAQQPIVTAQDQFGNPVTTQVSAVQTSGGNLNGTATTHAVTTVNGVATFSGLFVTNAASSLTLTFSAGSLTATSSAISVSPAAASKLSVTMQPSSTAAAGAVFTAQPQVSVVDAYGNMVSSDGTTVTVAETSGGNLNATTTGQTATISGGVASFSGLYVTNAGAVTLTFTSGTLTSAVSAGINVSSAGASQLAFGVQPTATMAGSAISPAVTVKVQDQFGNTVTSDTSSVTIGSSTTAFTGSTLTVSAISGVATFSAVKPTTTGTLNTLTANDGSLTGATSATFTVNAGAANKLAFGVQPSTTTAGSAISPAVTVIVQDAFGNTVAGNSSSVTIGSSTTAFTGSTLTVAAVSGVATFSAVKPTTAGTANTLTATDGALTAATSATFTVNALAAAKLAFGVQPSTTTAGSAISPAVTVKVQDQFGNTVTSDTSSVTISSATTAFTGSTLTVAAVNGVATFNAVNPTTAGASKTLTASDGALTGATSATFTVNPAAANMLAFGVQPGTTSAGSAISPAVTVKVQDQFGNTVTSDTSSVTIGSGTTAFTGSTLTVSAVSGVATFNAVKPTTVGIGNTLTASDGSLTGTTSATFTVNPGAANKLAFGVQPSTTTAGTALNPAVTVIVQDSFGNTVSNNTSSVTIGSSTTSFTGSTLTVAAVSGVATFSAVKPTTSGTANTLTATDGALTGATSTTFTVNALAAAKLAFGVQPSTTTTGSAISPAVTVKVQDQFGNTVTSDTSSVTIGSASTAFTGSTLTVPATSGVASFSAVKPITAGTGSTLTATDGALTGATSATFTINAAPTTTAVTSSPTTSVFGQAVVFTATVTDANGLTPTGTVTFKNGSTTFGTGLLDGSAQATFTTSSLAVGSQAITAVYGGDNTFAGSTSPAITQTVSKANTSAELVSSLNPACVSHAVVFTATVTSVGPGTGTPTGTVTFKDGATSLASITLNSGVTTFTTSTLSAGAHSITAVYNGSSSFNTSTSAALPEMINALPTATVSGSGAICPGNSTNIQAVLTGTGPWTVTWSDGVTQNNVITSPAVRSVNPASTTTYTVASVSDSNCSNTGTGSATVIVNLPPSITSQPPSSMTLCAGSPAVLSLTANGSGLTYQWLKNGVNLVNGGNISGATSATLTINPTGTGDSGSYSVAVAGVCGPSVTSSNSSLTVHPTPSATISAAAEVCANSANNIASVADAGPGATYGWSISKGGTITSGANTPNITYTVGASGTITLTANVTNSFGCRASANTSVIVPAADRWIEGWANATPMGWQASTFNKNTATYSEGMSVPTRFVLTNMCPGSSWSINIVYDFQNANTSQHFYDFLTSYNTSEQTELGSECADHMCSGSPTTFPIPADPALSYKIPGVFTVYNGTITNVSPVTVVSLNSSTISKQYTISGVTAPGATLQDVLILAGAHLAGEIQWGPGNGAATWSGASGKMYVQFTTDSSLGNFAVNPSDIAQLGDLSLVTMSATAGPICAGSTINYSLLVSNAGPQQAQSVSVQDNLPPGLTLVSATMSQGTVTGTTNLSFALGNLNALSNATISMVVSVDPGGAAGSYINTATISATSPTDPNLNNNTLSATTLVYARTTASPLADQLGCLGIPTTFSTVAAGTGPFTYQWSKNGTKISGATTALLTIPSVSSSDAGTYCVVVAGTCNSVTNCGTLTVSTNASTSPLVNLQKCPGDTAVFSTTPSGTGPFTITWKKNGVIIPGQTSTSLILPNVSSVDAGTYCVDVVGYCNATNNCATLTINSPVQVVSSPTNQTVCPGSNVTFTVSATGSGLAYQWYAGTNLLSAQTASSLTLTNVSATNGVSYSVVVSGACGNPVTNTANLSVTLPVVTAPADVTMACTNSLDPSVNPLLGAATVADNCTTLAATYSDQMISSNCPGNYTIKRTWTSQDGVGDVSTAVQVITMQDTAPVVVAPPNLVLAYTADTGTNSTGVATVLAGCGTVGLGYADSVTTQAGGSQVISRTWVGTDGCGNSGTAVQTITLNAPSALILPTQSNVVLTDLVTMVITNTATDPNGSTNTLTYQLINPPAGVTVDTNGIITWTPTLSQSPSTNIITTVVTTTEVNATGSTTISTTNSFVVTVSSPYDGLDMMVDTDGDGLTNLVEYAVGSNPNNPADATSRIIIWITQANENHYLAMKFTRRVNATALGLQYLPEVTADKINWASDASNVLLLGVTPYDSEFDWVTVRDQTPITPSMARFIRLHIVSTLNQSFSPIWIGSDTLIQGITTGLNSRTTFFSQRMILPVLYAGTVSSVQNTMLTDTNASWASQFGNGGIPAYAEFNDGTMADIANAPTSKSLSMAGSLSGVASPGDAYRIRAHFTVASLFGTNNETGLQSGGNTEQADTIQVLIPATQQTLTLFYYDDGVNHGWLTADYTPADNLVIYPEQGLLVTRVAAGNRDLYLCGPIKTDMTVVPVQPGYNLVGTLKSLSPVTLAALNLYTGDPVTGLASGGNTADSDSLLVVQPDGTTATYFYYKDNFGNEGWLDANYSLSANVPIKAGSAFFVHRLPSRSGFDWTIPAE